MVITFAICTNTIAEWTEYPKRWVERGNMPDIETMDYNKLPHDFGYGSGTRIKWIKDNILADSEQGIHWGKDTDE